MLASLVVVPGAALSTQSAVGIEPELILAKGEERTISAQRWVFSRVNIPADAVLRVERGSTNPFHLIVSGTMTLNGAIIYERADGSNRIVTVRGENGQPMQIEFARISRGGTGGNGAGRVDRRGGKGALGSTENGGGGGGGAWYYHWARGTESGEGGDAPDIRGGGSNLRCGYAGANGGARVEHDAGGVIVLEVAGLFDGSDGVIRARGTEGAVGTAGLPRGRTGSGVHGCFNEASGGGGGGPGGQGGSLVAFLNGGVTSYPQVTVAGGRGGGTVGSQEGAAGGAGQNGNAGAVYWYVR